MVAQTLIGAIGQPQDVVISEGGIEFIQAQPIAAATRVKVKMVLMPRAHGLLLRGKVSHCDARPDGNFEVGTEFTDMTDAQRQLLARYILQRQQQQRRQQLEQTDPAP
ncbi:PilZ domain protein [compost metagenome]